MCCYPFCRFLLPWMIVSVFTASVYAQVKGDGVPPAQDIVALSRQAKGQFTPLTDGDLSDAKQRLRQAVLRLEKRLEREGENGQTWKGYLKLDELGANLAENKSPDLERLDAIYSRFDRPHEGLELVWFVDVRLRCGDT